MGDGGDAKLFVRPLWQVSELLAKEKEKEKPGQPCRNRLRRLCSFFYKCCCVRRKWRRKRTVREKWQSFKAGVRSIAFRKVLKKIGHEKRYDIFLVSQESDKELADWMIKFCANRSLEVFYESP